MKRSLAPCWSRRKRVSTSFPKGIRGIAQPGSAAVLGTAGRWFESSCPDHAPRIFRLMLVRAIDSPAGIQFGAVVHDRPGEGDDRRSLDRLNPIALCVLHVAVFFASIPVDAVSYVVRHIGLAHFSPRDVAVYTLNDRR